MTRLPTRSVTRRLRGLALLLAVTAFAMTGCLRYELSISVNDDGSGVLGTVVAISDAFTQLSGVSSEELVPTDGLPPDVEAREYHEDGFTGIELAIPFANEAQLALITAGMSDGSGAGEPGDFTLERNDAGGWTFAMLATVEGDGATAAPAEPPPAELLEGAFFRVRIALPGVLAEHNADRIEDGALVWELDLTATEPRQLTARTTAAAPAPPESGHGPALLEGDAARADRSDSVAGAAPAAIATAGLIAALALVWRFGLRQRGQPRG